MSTQPTALAQLRHLYQNMLNGGVRDTASAKRIAEGLLGPAIEALERGTPATGGEPVAWIRFQPPYRPDVLVQRHRPTLDGEPDTQYRPLVFGDTSPQPVREPLTPEQIKDLRRNHPAEDTCGWSYELGLRDGERAHGITGGQHGTE